MWYNISILKKGVPNMERAELEQTFKELKERLEWAETEGEEADERLAMQAIVQTAVDKSLDLELHLLPHETQAWLNKTIMEYFTRCFIAWW